MKKILSLTLTSFVVLVASCSRSHETSQPAAAVRTVKVETVKTSSLDDYYEAVGTVQAKTSSVIAARIIGNVVKVNVREGDRVHAGQILIEIENREAQTQTTKAEAGVRESSDALDEVERNIRAAESAREAAQANERLAASTFNRYQALFNRQSASPQEFDEVRTKLEIAKAESERADRQLLAIKARQNQMQARISQAKADLASAHINAGYARIAAPINGVVVSKQTEVGNLATPGAPLLTIENDSSYQLEVAVEESQLGKIHLRDQALATIDSLDARELLCLVAEIVPAADPSSRSYTVKLALPNVGGTQFRSGLYGKARFVSGQRQVLAIPQTAIMQRGQLISVFVVDQSGVARLRLIKTGKTYGARIEVLSGLSDGDQLVVEDVKSIQDGTRVRGQQQLASR